MDHRHIKCLMATSWFDVPAQPVGLLLMNLLVDHMWLSLSHTFAVMVSTAAPGMTPMLVMGIFIKLGSPGILNGLGF